MKLAVFILFISLNYQVTDLISQRKAQVLAIEQSLIAFKELEYSYGDAEGIIKFYQDSAKTQMRILKENDSGSYGRSTSDYYSVDNKLIYLYRFELSWDGMAPDDYSLTSTQYYFSDELSGLKTTHTLKTTSEELMEEDFIRLEAVKKDTVELSVEDYHSLYRDFTYLLNQE